MQQFAKDLQHFKRKRREYIICGDWNIVHKAIDIKNWRANQKNSGCLPEERAWLDRLFGKMGWLDAFRQLNQEAEQYTFHPQERAFLDDKFRHAAVGNPEQVKHKIDQLMEDFGADELMAVTITYDFEARVRSYELLAEAYG